MTTTDDDDLTVLQTTGHEARQGPGAWNSAMPTESSRDFRATVRRLATVVGDEIPILAVVGVADGLQRRTHRARPLVARHRHRHHRHRRDDR